MEDLAVKADNTIGARLKVRENNFDAIRLVAAFAVILSHSFPISEGNLGSEREPFQRLSGYCSLGEVSVAIFFVISGLLVARSYLSDSNPFSYLRKRLLRIVPGLMVCVAFCIFVMGPMFTELKFKDYIFNRDILHFSKNAFLLPGHFNLPGVFETWEMSDPRNAVNGSLWSLPLEFLMYLAVLGLGMCRLLNKRWCLILVAVALLFEWLVVERIGFTPYTTMARYRVWIEQLPHLGFFFFGGTLMLLFKDSIVLDWKLFAGCVAVVVITWQGTFEWVLTAVGHPELIRHAMTRPPHGYFVFSVCLPYMVMYLAFVRIPILRPVLQSATKWGDFSYGVYLYGFPVEQMIYRTWGDRLPFAAFIALSCAGTLVLAVLSWHLVEKPFMKMKKKPAKKDFGRPDLNVELPEPSNHTVRPPVTLQRQASVLRQVIFFV